jgi:methylenetetrahydrofolate reductase (NADPH)
MPACAISWRCAAIRPAGIGTVYEPHPEGYHQTSADLVAGLKKRIGDFEVTVSAYPEKHPESGLARCRYRCAEEEGRCRRDARNHQFFFDNDLYFRYLDKVRARGIDIPILPGIVPCRTSSRPRIFAAQDRRQRAATGWPTASRVWKTMSRRASSSRPPSAPSRSSTSIDRGVTDLPFLHDEPRRPCLCHLPSAGLAAVEKAAAKHQVSSFRRGAGGVSLCPISFPLPSTAPRSSQALCAEAAQANASSCSTARWAR